MPTLARRCRCETALSLSLSIIDDVYRHLLQITFAEKFTRCKEMRTEKPNIFKRSNMKTTTDTFLCFLSPGFTSAFPPQLSLQCNTHFVHRVGLLRPGCLYLQGDGSYRTDRHVKCDSWCSWLWPWTVCFIHFVSVTLACLSFHFYHYCANKWSFRVLLVFLFFPQLRQMVRPPIFVCVLHLFLVFARWDIDNQVCWDSVNT